MRKIPIDKFLLTMAMVERERIMSILDEYHRKEKLSEQQIANKSMFEGYVHGLNFMEDALKEALNDQSKTRQIH
tara:strand:+ start:118 stop:339 length:222 start_codon:yes stop_codon:yes gene_type:complete